MASGCSHVCSSPRHSHHETAPVGCTVRRESPFVNVDAAAAAAANDDDDDESEVVPSSIAGVAAVAGSVLVRNPGMSRFFV